MSDSVITVSNISKAVDTRQLLSDISFTVNEQSLVSIIGPNGAGKSTLIKIILGLDTHYDGTVTIRPGEQIQYIPQLTTTDLYQLPISVKEYLKIATTPLFSSRAIPDIDFDNALSHVGVSPQVLDQPYFNLSGGERQRVAIARALLSNPSILVLDEPLAAVDYASRNGLYELIRHLQQDHGMTVLLVSHDIESVLPLSDHVLCINKTLHTDCHPSDFTATDGQCHQSIHHHC